MQEGRRVQLFARVRLPTPTRRSSFWQGRLGCTDGMEWTGSRVFALTDVRPCFYYAFQPACFFLLFDGLFGRVDGWREKHRLSVMGQFCLVGF